MRGRPLSMRSARYTPMADRPLRVLHVVPGLAPQLGGISTYVLEASRALRDAGCHVEIFTTDLQAPASARADRAGGDLHALWDGYAPATAFEVGRARRFAYAPKMLSALVEAAPRFDVMHLHALHLYPTFAGFRAARRTGVPYVVSPHGALDPYIRGNGRLRKRITWELWERRMLNGAAAVHFTTAAEVEALSEPLAARRARVVAPGVELDEVAHGSAGAFRERWRLDGDPTIGYLGRIARKKS